MRERAARGYFINLTKLHLTLSQSQLAQEYLGCAWGVFEAGRSSRKLRKCRKRFISQNIIGGTVCREAGWALRLEKCTMHNAQCTIWLRAETLLISQSCT